jgi:hypothetical protein
LVGSSSSFYAEPPRRSTAIAAVPLQVLEDAADDLRVFDAGDDFDRAAALLADSISMPGSGGPRPSTSFEPFSYATMPRDAASQCARSQKKPAQNIGLAIQIGWPHATFRAF